MKSMKVLESETVELIERLDKEKETMCGRSWGGLGSIYVAIKDAMMLLKDLLEKSQDLNRELFDVECELSSTQRGCKYNYDRAQRAERRIKELEQGIENLYIERDEARAELERVRKCVCAGCLSGSGLPELHTCEDGRIKDDLTDARTEIARLTEERDEASMEKRHMLNRISQLTAERGEALLSERLLNDQQYEAFLVEDRLTKERDEARAEIERLKSEIQEGHDSYYHYEREYAYAQALLRIQRLATQANALHDAQTIAVDALAGRKVPSGDEERIRANRAEAALQSLIDSGQCRDDRPPCRQLERARDRARAEYAQLRKVANRCAGAWNASYVELQNAVLALRAALHPEQEEDDDA